MATIIKNRQVETDPWQLHKPAADATDTALPDGDVIVPLSLWLTQRDALLKRGTRLGVWLASNEDPAKIAGDLDHFSVIAVNFPKFTDGRGYSIGRLLRERYNWRGELRAFGDLFRDQLFYLSRVGFDAYALRAGEDQQEAVASLQDFSDAYQVSVERPQPLFRRRLGNAA